MTLNILENHNLAEYTTMHLGGDARYYVEVNCLHELKEALELAKLKGLPVFVLGGGSNTLIDDNGFDGMVIRITNVSISFNGCEKPNADFIQMTADAGLPLETAVYMTCRNELEGMESLSGIPGSVGGAVVQNAGAYGQEIADTFISAKAIHRDTLEIADLCAKDLEFGYRSTRLKKPDNPWIIVSASFRLKPFDAESACQRCTARGFKKLIEQPPKTALELREAILETRKSKGMCHDPEDSDTHSVGSFFVNPVVSAEFAEKLPEMPKYDAPDGIKLSAAWLIEHSGFTRGFQLGGAAISGKHCLALVNRNNASSREVIALARNISDQVFSTYGVRLHPEAIYLAPSGIQPIPFG